MFYLWIQWNISLEKPGYENLNVFTIEMDAISFNKIFWGKIF